MPPLLTSSKSRSWLAPRQVLRCPGAQVLKCLVGFLETRWTSINALLLPSLCPTSAIELVREGAKKAMASTAKSDIGQQGGPQNWRLLADLNQRLCFPPEIATTNLRQDLVLWSSSLRKVNIIELTVPWRDEVEEVSERKNLKYAELNIMAGKPWFAQWKSAAEALWANQQPGGLRTWDSSWTPFCFHPTDIRGKSRRGRKWDARHCQRALWRCCGLIIETPVKEGTQLMTPMKLCPRPSHMHDHHNTLTQSVIEHHHSYRLTYV